MPQTTAMEFRGMPNPGSMEEYLKVSDQMAGMAASGGQWTLRQTSGRFSVWGGQAPPVYLPPEQIEEDDVVRCINNSYYLSDHDAFSQTAGLYGLWSQGPPCEGSARAIP